MQEEEFKVSKNSEAPSLQTYSVDIPGQSSSYEQARKLTIVKNVGIHFILSTMLLLLSFFLYFHFFKAEAHTGILLPIMEPVKLASQILTSRHIQTSHLTNYSITLNFNHTGADTDIDSKSRIANGLSSIYDKFPDTQMFQYKNKSFVFQLKNSQAFLMQKLKKLQSEESGNDQKQGKQFNKEKYSLTKILNILEQLEVNQFTDELNTSFAEIKLLEVILDYLHDSLEVYDIDQAMILIINWPTGEIVLEQWNGGNTKELN